MSKVTLGRVYREGLGRVGRTIERINPHGHGFAQRAEKLAKTLGLHSPSDVCTDVIAESALARALEHYRPVKYVLEGAPPCIAWGRSSNNRRELGFLQDLLGRHGLTMRFENLAFAEQSPAPGVVDVDSEFASTIRHQFQVYLSDRQSLTVLVLRQLIKYTTSFVDWCYSIPESPANRISFGAVANDHSPVQVAFSMRLRMLGIPRVYVQHAEVTEVFPPLDFEISILRNERSHEIYSSIGPIEGEVFVAPRHQERFALEVLTRKQSAPVRVGIYLTAVNDLDALGRLLDSLTRNPSVGEVFVKPHPATDHSTIGPVLPERVQLCDGIPSSNHIGVVGNSSVVTELLQKGVPVYNYFGLDPIKDDYYGFVKEGVTKQIEDTDLLRDFWNTQPYTADDAWLSKYKRFEPGSDCDVEALVQRLIRILGKHEFVGHHGSLGSDATNTREPAWLRADGQMKRWKRRLGKHEWLRRLVCRMSSYWRLLPK